MAKDTKWKSSQVNANLRHLGLRSTKLILYHNRNVLKGCGFDSHFNNNYGFSLFFSMMSI